MRTKKNGKRKTVSGKCRRILRYRGGKKLFFIFHFSFFIFHFSFSERYQISEVTYSLEKTRGSDLRRVVPVNTEKIFESKEEFDAYLADLEQRLMNTRAFQNTELITDSADKTSATDADFTDSADSSNPTVSEDEEQVTKISLHISAADSKHLLILPYPKYDSNDGLIFKIKVKDVNFLGTMNTLNAGVFAGIKEDVKTGDQNITFGAEFNYRYPFTLGTFLGSWNNNFELEYTSGVDELEFWSGTGFTFELPFRRVSLVLDVSEQANRILEYAEYGDIQHFTSDLKLSAPVKLLDIENWGFVFWTPFIDGIVSYDKDGISVLNDDLASPVLSAGESVSTARINWHGNFRTGVSAKIGHSIGWDFKQEEVEPRVFGELQAFKGFTYIGLNMRFSAFATKSNRATVGELIRGVRDKQKYKNDTHKALKTPSALVLNIDIPIHLITTDWNGWLGSIFGEDSLFSRTFAWAGKFNFELQAAPFIDISLTKNEMTDRLFSPKDGWYTGGIEFLLFPERWKGIVMRASAGFDLGRAFIAEKYPEKLDMSWREKVKKYEVYAGIGLHY